MSAPQPAPDTTRYVIALESNERKLQIIGSPKGQGLPRTAAERLARKYRACYPRLNVLVMPISKLDMNTAPLGQRPSPNN